MESCVFTGQNNDTPIINDNLTINCEGFLAADWKAGEGGDGSFEDPSFAALAGGEEGLGTNPHCGQMYAMPEKSKDASYVYFMIAAAEQETSKDLYIGEEICDRVGNEGCDETVAIHLPQLSSILSYENDSPLKIGDFDATVCSDFAWETDNEGTLENPKSAIITGSDDSFCGRIYQFEDSYFAIKAHDNSSAESETIILDKASCDAVCEADCEPGSIGA
eukprot:GHVP01009292.1.p1 GENE.GHVP01009292.1~~GHVP01009292.1.p1  ORF type:complete len:220 (-),score=44.40 GHVP01009292.1:416-1075(-)